MRAKCLLCNQIDQISDDDPLAKRLRNRPIHTYTCPECYDRISRKAKTRRGVTQSTE
ncbi:YlaI family protein [Salicibibacter cibi]|uniref:YlaI family protein n=1 Tax=Salicibibacter cibi TaxID=2743001 RepID=A0A7T6ZF72_9BACI|nr:YlaI family protein [Salicibibacter cibi]QQK81971.1 YlaI family protein [Salicibibacter cibi]